MKAPYFPFYPGDYLADTIGLSCCEHGVYLLLLAVSWQRGSLPDDMDHLSRLAASPPIESLRFVLQEYWTLTDQGWINKRMEVERMRMRDRSEKAKKSAGARWKNALPKDDANAMRTHSERNALHLHSQSTTVVVQEEGPKKPKRKTPSELIEAANVHAHCVRSVLEEWVAYKQTSTKPYKNPMGVSAASNILGSHPPEQQQDMLNNALAGQWAGLHAPTGNNGHATHQPRNESATDRARRVADEHFGRTDEPSSPRDGSELRGAVFGQGSNGAGSQDVGVIVDGEFSRER